ncbi:MAG: uroporphyrinogen-III C-methyltransferase [Dehalococcoidia bacterium]|nr:uroporphyrinogen-III C-methyltransferase [Dehalococcoidia bacterium]
MAGKVYLIGAGPGDPGLITVRGLGILQRADVVVHDRLVDSRLLEQAASEAEMVYVGKGRGRRAMEQEAISDLLVGRASQDRVVARLKGGDPFVFGRGGEEALALAKAGVPFEVVPGVTSAVAAPAYAGIPVTHRGMATSFTVVSGSEDPSKDGSSVDWARLAKAGGTLVVLMGWSSLEPITEALALGGMDRDTPAALVQWGTEPHQRSVTGTLGNIAARARDAGLAPPVAMVFGPVVELRREIRWSEARPLFGKRIIVTRSRSQASVLSNMLAEAGAYPMELPTIRTVPPEDYSELDRAIRSLSGYDWAVLTSANGVDALFGRMTALGLDSRALGGVKVAAIGPATAQALTRYGIRADLVPGQYVAESVVAEMERRGVTGARVLLARADIGRKALPEGLSRLGAAVDDVTAYRTVAPEDARQRADELLAKDTPDLITFTSSSTVTNLMALLDGDTSLVRELPSACIGPITADTARERGLRVEIEAQEYTVPGLVRAITEHYS